jgi:hypothetical protein
MLTEYQKEVISKLSKEKQNFIKKQLNILDDWMKGSMFMPCDGKCYHCGVDLIEREIKNGNDGSQLVTGCFNCCKSYCD